MSESTFVPTPNPDTLGFITKMAAGYCLKPNVDEVVECATAGVRRAIDTLNMRLWNWALAYQDITFVAATGEYQAEADLKAPRRFTLIDSDSLEAGTLTYYPWPEFITRLAHDPSTEPCSYSLSNMTQFGTITLSASPSTDWVVKYPTGRLWYYRRVPYPVATSDIVIAPPEIVAYVLEYASGFTADRYAVNKAPMAYARAEMLKRDLIRDDNETSPDWEGMR